MTTNRPSYTFHLFLGMEPTDQYARSGPRLHTSHEGGAISVSLSGESEYVVGTPEQIAEWAAEVLAIAQAEMFARPAR